ncbi:unnamed protein product [Auanema sp. JU1783]|nr:unnamed protein product [Auanema sp. JU1783]
MSLEYRIGTKNDNEIVHQFLLNHFRVTEPITSTINATKDDVFDFFIDLRDGGLTNEKWSTLCFDGPELVGISLNYTKLVEGSPESESSSFDPRADFAKAIESGPYTQLNANRLVVFVETVEAGMAKLINAPKKIFKIDVLCVRSDYQGKGIASQMLRRAEQAAVDAGCSYIISTATAVASQTLFAKNGFTVLRELPFSCFRENGVAVYENLTDGGRAAKLMTKPMPEKQNDEEEEEEDLK